MNKFTVIYSDKTEFSGHPFKGDWNRIDDTKTITKFIYLFNNYCVVMEGFKQYNHCIEKLGLQVKGISRILLMGRRGKDTLIIIFDGIDKKIYKKMTLHGKEYGKQILAGWKKGKLKEPKAYFKEIKNAKT